VEVAAEEPDRSLPETLESGARSDVNERAWIAGLSVLLALAVATWADIAPPVKGVGGDRSDCVNDMTCWAHAFMDGPSDR
jgi:hypothetical protein